MKACTTAEAARAARISRATLQAWIATGKISAPDVQLVAGKAVRLWQQKDIAKLRAVRAEIYYQKRGRPRKQKDGVR